MRPSLAALLCTVLCGCSVNLHGPAPGTGRTVIAISKNDAARTISEFLSEEAKAGRVSGFLIKDDSFHFKVGGLETVFRLVEFKDTSVQPAYTLSLESHGIILGKPPTAETERVIDVYEKAQSSLVHAGRRLEGADSPAIIEDSWSNNEHP